jgi:O-antigen/teichoic acid export membrane protein
MMDSSVQKQFAIGRIRSVLRSAGISQTIVLGTAMVAAGGMDYAVNVLVGRWLQPVEYGIFVSVNAIVQILVLLAIAIRVVVGFYTAEIQARDGSTGRVGAFMFQAWRWAWRWGIVTTLLMAALAPVLAHVLRLTNSWPLLAASLMVLMLFLRETTYGALQGVQAFGGLGLVQVAQAFLRILFAAALIALGFRASGAIFAQPLSCGIGLLPAIWCLWPYFARRELTVKHRVSSQYSANMFFGLAVFGVLTNLDAVFVKHYFSAQMAGLYAPVVTLAKICLFLPWAVGVILVPKVMQRRAAGQDPRPILLLSLAAAIAPGLLITSLYFLVHGTLVVRIFSGTYADPGIVLGLASLATTFYAGLNIWLNYAVAIERPAFIYALLAVAVAQAIGMVVFGRDDLVSMTIVMVFFAVLGNLAGFFTARLRAEFPGGVRVDAAVNRRLGRINLECHGNKKIA